ncbi:zinc-dependent metalloprotease family protein [Agromyces sp. NPDC057679]|uniref:zinc-dependent metalloprotease family protein n=1 Tax=Agromyces sp. NPDC057679 TaxID=3346207 RepID=UPI00366D9075
MGTSTPAATGRSPLRKTVTAAFTFTVIAALAAGAVTPAHADEPGQLKVTGHLVVVESEDTAEGQINVDGPADAATQNHIVTDDGQWVPVEGDAIPEDTPPGAAVEAVVEIPASVPVDIAGTVDADTAAGQEVVAAAAEVGATFEAVNATVEEPQVQAAAATPVAHTVEIAVVTSKDGTNVAPVDDNAVRAMMTRVSAFFKEQTGGKVLGFNVGKIVRYQTAADVCAQSTVWTEASVKLGRSTSNFYWQSPSTHLLVIAPANCGTGSGLGTVGSGPDNGGLSWASYNQFVLDQTVAHELGHNISLRHSNLENCTYPAYDKPGCAALEYDDLYDVMGRGYVICDPACRTNAQLPALNATHKARLGAYPAADLLNVSSGQGVTVTKTVTLNAASALSGARAAKIIDPDTGDVYYLEYRNGTGRDTNALYTFKSGLGGGVRIMKIVANASVVTPYRTGSAATQTWLRWPVGSTFTSNSKNVKITVNAASGATATATVTLSSSVTKTFTGDALPVIIGKGQIGELMAVAPGPGWAPTGTYSYQWFRNGKAIAGATSNAYKTTEEDSGTQLTAAVTSKLDGYLSRTLTSLPEAIVTLQEFTGTDPLKITGVVQPGKTVTASRGANWGPTPTLISHQWMLNGVKIQTPAGRSASYTIAAADLGKTLTVSATYSKSGFRTKTWTSSGIKVELPTFIGSGLPGIAGTRVLNSTLTAAPAAWTPAPTSVQYQWFRDGKAIAGATAKTYKLTTLDVGTNTAVAITYSRAGYAPKTWRSSDKLITVAAQQFSGKAVPAVSGARRVSQTLTASPGADWAPAATSISYQWLRDGKAIAGATKSKYVQTSADVGHFVTVKITIARSGYQTRSMVSAPSTKTTVLLQTPSGKPATPGKPTFTGSVKPGQTLTANFGSGWNPFPSTIKYQWLRDGKAIAGSTFRTYKVTEADRGKQISVKVTGSKAGFLDAVGQSPAVKAG